MRAVNNGNAVLEICVAQPIGGLGNRVHINGIEFSLFIALGPRRRMLYIGFDGGLRRGALTAPGAPPKQI
jgi:hypothetical protein